MTNQFVAQLAGFSASSRTVARSATAAGEADSPRSVTRGESSPGSEGYQRCNVDWLNATFQAPDNYSPAQFLGLLTRLFGRPVTGSESRGLFGFERSIKLITQVGSRSFPIGALAYGGESQKGRWMLQFTGAGCGVVRSWSKTRKLLQALKAKITRVDLALDFLNGEHTVDDAVRLYGEDAFTNGGRRPSSSVAGDWMGGVKGRTLYIGQASNGKMLRVYEKGKQLGNVDSDWTRFEVQLGNRDRVIPLEVLTERDKFFAGCYPALQGLMDCAGERIQTQQTNGVATLSHLFRHMKRSYGKLFDVFTRTDEFDYAELVQELRVIGAPRRVQPSALACGLTWAQLLAQIKKGNRA